MRRLVTSLALSMVAVLALMPSAGAITFGKPDGNGHPEVGALLAEKAYSDGTWVQCSGTLISSTVLLTAAHCQDGRDRMAVTFEPVYVAGRSKVHWGSYHADPDYNQTQSDPQDIAVVVFDKPVRGITPAALPSLDSLSDLSGSQTFTSVGYGAQSVTNGPGGKRLSYEDVRWFSSGTLNSINPAWLRISQNPSTGNSGTCYGDSGGPNFLGSGDSETDIVAATTITGDMWCRSTNVTYRLDTESARDFLAGYVTLPSVP